MIIKKLYRFYFHFMHKKVSHFQLFFSQTADFFLRIPSGCTESGKAGSPHHCRIFIALALRFESSITSKACCCKNFSSSVSATMVMPCGLE